MGVSWLWEWVGTGWDGMDKDGMWLATCVLSVRFSFSSPAAHPQYSDDVGGFRIIAKCRASCVAAFLRFRTFLGIPRGLKACVCESFVPYTEVQSVYLLLRINSTLLCYRIWLQGRPGSMTR